MKPIWNGSLSFGLVNIPVKVYVASEEHGIEFDMLHAKDHGPIRYARICTLDGKEIPYNEIVKGYEYEKGKYIIVKKEDFEKANVKKTSTIEIFSFALLDEIDPLYFVKPYYLEPDKKASKAYGLLRDALKKAKKVAVARYVFRNKEHVGIIWAHDDVLVLNQLRYHSEVRPHASLALPPKEKKIGKETEFAFKLIDKLTEPFKPEKYHDTYTEELVKTIKAKAKGKKVIAKGKAPTPSHTADLVQLLKESLGKKPHVIKSPPKAARRAHRR